MQRPLYPQTHTKELSNMEAQRKSQAKPDTSKANEKDTTAVETPAPVETTPETKVEEQPKKRRSPIERLQEQLEAERAKAAERAGKKLVKAEAELESAAAGAKKALARLEKAKAEVDSLKKEIGGVDPIVAATTEAELESERAAAAEAETQQV